MFEAVKLLVLEKVSRVRAWFSAIIGKVKDFLSRIKD